MDAIAIFLTALTILFIIIASIFMLMAAVALVDMLRDVWR